MAKLIYKGKSLTGGGGSDLTYEVLATASASASTYKAQIEELKIAFDKLTDDEKMRSGIVRTNGTKRNIYLYTAEGIYSTYSVVSTLMGAESINIDEATFYGYNSSTGAITNHTTTASNWSMQLVLLDTESNGSSGGGTVKIDVDSELDTTSENPVQNKIIANALGGKQDSLTAGENITIDDDGTIHAVNVSGREMEMSYDADNDRLMFNTGEELSIKPNPGYRVVASIPKDGKTWGEQLAAIKEVYYTLSYAEKLKCVLTRYNVEVFFPYSIGFGIQPAIFTSSTTLYSGTAKRLVVDSMNLDEGSFYRGTVNTDGTVTINNYGNSNSNETMELYVLD